MTISLTNVFEGSATSSTGSTFAVTGTITTAGDPVACFVTCDSGNTVSSIADTAGNTYTKKDDQADGIDLQRVTVWVGVGGGGTGSNTITATFNAASSFVGVQGGEVAGSSGYDIFAAGAVQQTPTTATDAVATATATPSVAPGLIVALSSNTSGAAAPAAGTGFTDNGTGWVNAGPSRLESKRYTSTSAIAGTFTAGSNSAHTTLSLLFKEAGAGAATVGPGLKTSPGPGISPNKQTLFAARNLSNRSSTDVTVSLTGQSATFASGTLSTALSVPLIGAAATFAPGTLTASLDKVGRPLVSGPGISPDYTKLFLGRQLSTTVNASSDVTVALTGQAAAFAAGTLAPSTSVPLAGQSATFGAGTMSTGNDVTVGLIGQSAAFTAGTLAPSTAIALTGSSATFAPGTLIATPTVALTGQAATMAAGTLTPNLGLALSGLPAIFTAGTMTGAATGDVTVALTGQAAIFTAGMMTPSGGDVIAGGSNSGGGGGGRSLSWSGKFEFSPRKRHANVTAVPKRTITPVSSDNIAELASKLSVKSANIVDHEIPQDDDDEAMEHLLAAMTIPAHILEMLKALK